MLPALKKRNNFNKSNKRSLLANFKRERLQPVRSVATSLFIVFFAALFSGCTESGSVGGGIVGPGTDIKIDTLNISGLHVDTLIAYSGNLDFFSAGRFHDPLFGNITATGLFKPVLAPNADSLAFDEKTNVTLNLTVFPDAVYGDTLAAQTFGLYEAKELWRGNEWRIRDDIQFGASPLATFSIANEDTIQIPLPDSWVEEYAKYFNSDEASRDSSFVREFFGLVLVPQNSAKIVAVNPFTTFFLATNVDVVKPDSVLEEVPRLDSLKLAIRTLSGDATLRSWAYSVKRAEVNASPHSSSKLISTFERAIHFDYDFNFEDIEPRKIAKVELIFYVDKLLLEQSINQAGRGAVRPESEILNLHFVEGDELPQSISSNTSLAEATYNEEDEAYHFNLTQPVVTGFFEVFGSERIFYLTIGENEGIIRSGLIFNSLTEGKAPKVVVTYVETENN